MFLRRFILLVICISSVLGFTWKSLCKNGKRSKSDKIIEVFEKCYRWQMNWAKVHTIFSPTKCKWVLNGYHFLHHLWNWKRIEQLLIGVILNYSKEKTFLPRISFPIAKLANLAMFIFITVLLYLTPFYYWWFYKKRHSKA